MEGLCAYPDYLDRLARVIDGIASAGHTDEAIVLGQSCTGLAAHFAAAPHFMACMSAAPNKTFHKYFIRMCFDDEVEKIQLLLRHCERKQLRVGAEAPLTRGVHHAVSKGNMAALRVLLDAWPETASQRNAEGQTAFHVAAQHGQLPALRLLEEVYPTGLALKDSAGQMPLHTCCASGSTASAGHYDTARYLSRCTDLHAVDSQGRTPSILAVLAGDVRMINVLLEQPGVKMEHADNSGRTMLIHAMCGGNARMVQALLAHGASLDPKARYKGGWTLLHYAARYGQESMVTQLLANGANVHAKTDKGYDAVLLAVWGGHESILRVLRQHFVYHELTYKPAGRVGHMEGLGPAHVAAIAGRASVVRLLLSLHDSSNFNVSLVKRARWLADELWSVRHPSGNEVDRGAHEPQVDHVFYNGGEATADDRLGYTAAMLARKLGRAEATEALTAAA